MVLLLSPSLILGFSVSLLLISPSLSLTCTSQNFTSNLKFPNCTDLPYLGSYLHWNYDTAKNSLSIAFIAPPAKPSGWIAWGINPTSTGMIGTQSLIAYKHSNGSLTANTYNISSFAIAPSNISFHVSGLRAEDSGGMMKIFATLAFPPNTKEVFQVWQVGGSVTDGTPDRHEMRPENKMSMGTLALVEAQRNATTSGNDSSSTDGQSPSAPDNGGGISLISKDSNAVFSVSMLILGILVLF
ncbi:hypothetical protein LguiB_030885 [Lonicera macranthoides]